MKAPNLQSGLIRLTNYFDLIDFRLLVNIAETLSLSRGAELTNMSAPAASNRIKKIEDVLGVKLFVRNSHGLSPTQSGYRALQGAKEILSQFDNLVSELSPTSSEIRGNIRLYANTLSINGSVPNVLQGFLLKHPEVNISLQEHSSSMITRALVSGDADVGILATDTQSDRLHYTTYGHESLVLITGQTHDLAKQKKVWFHETLQSDFIGLPSHAALQHFVLRMAGIEGTSIKLRIQANTFDSLCKLVEVGIGIGIVPETIAQEQLRNRKIVIVRLRDSWAERELSIVVRKEEPLSIAAQLLIKELLQNLDDRVQKSA